MTYAAAFRAGAIRRWHTNAALAATGDRLDAHAGRVARLILAWHPAPSVALLRAALIHDDGEIGTGDIPGPIKATLPVDVALTLERIEEAARAEIWGEDPEITEDEALWLALADRLDAYLWAHTHGADMGAHDWREARHLLNALGIRLHVVDKLRRLFDEVGA